MADKNERLVVGQRRRAAEIRKPAQEKILGALGIVGLRDGFGEKLAQIRFAQEFAVGVARLGQAVGVQQRRRARRQGVDRLLVSGVGLNPQRKTGGRADANFSVPGLKKSSGQCPALAEIIPPRCGSRYTTVAVMNMLTRDRSGNKVLFTAPSNSPGCAKRWRKERTVLRKTAANRDAGTPLPMTSAMTSSAVPSPAGIAS